MDIKRDIIFVFSQYEYLSLNWRPFQVRPVDKLTFSVFISSYFLKCYKKAGKFGYLTAGVSQSLCKPSN